MNVPRALKQRTESAYGNARASTRILWRKTKTCNRRKLHAPMNSVSGVEKSDGRLLPSRPHLLACSVDVHKSFAVFATNAVLVR
mmetsp:Transcript_23789/g.66449  ORF Transcript_23789/g.66449 Transcript_23789/m.66449 type:complete len:84 (-) Transcript_23789:88-339(-)